MRQGQGEDLIWSQASIATPSSLVRFTFGTIDDVIKIAAGCKPKLTFKACRDSCGPHESRQALNVSFGLQPAAIFMTSSMVPKVKRTRLDGVAIEACDQIRSSPCPCRMPW